MLQCKNNGAHADLLALSFMYGGNNPFYMDVPKWHKSQLIRPLTQHCFAKNYASSFLHSVAVLRRMERVKPALVKLLLSTQRPMNSWLRWVFVVIRSPFTFSAICSTFDDDVIRGREFARVAA